MPSATSLSLCREATALWPPTLVELTLFMLYVEQKSGTACSLLCILFCLGVALFTRPAIVGCWRRQENGALLCSCDHDLLRQQQEHDDTDNAAVKQQAGLGWATSGVCQGKLVRVTSGRLRLSSGTPMGKTVQRRQGRLLLQ